MPNIQRSRTSGADIISEKSVVQEAHGVRRPRIAFVCVHNSCRSQIAEAFSRAYAHDTFDVFSAGTEPSEIDPDALRLLTDRYGINVKDRQSSKHISDLPPVDIVVTMGCGVACPNVLCRHSEDWGIGDPTGSDDAVFIEVMETVYEKVLDLRERIRSGRL